MNPNNEDDLQCQMKDLSAYAIQQVWKAYKVKKALVQTLRSKREPVVVYYSSLSQNMKIKSDQFNLFTMLNNKNIKYYKFDLVDNSMAQGWVKEQLNKYQLPFVKINDKFIGGYEEVGVLNEVDLLNKIINKSNLDKYLDYENSCIICDEPRQGNICAQCQKPYTFFEII